MTSASMKLARAAALLLALACSQAFAHKASDAYLQLRVEPQSASLRIDVALRDLDVALDLDTDGDGRLTWREVRSAWPAIETYLRSNVAVQGCEFPNSAHALERRVDGAYAALTMSGRCVDVASRAIRYTVLHDVDPTHRGLARIVAGEGNPQLRVLDPGQPQEMREAVVEEGPTVAVEARAETAPVAAADPGLHPGYEFVREGVHHIVTGYDHVLFLLCLMLPAVMRRSPQGWRPVERLGEALMPVLGIVTAFTLAHSITLGLAATKWVSLSPSLIEPAIAVTIVLAAIDNLRPIFGGRRALVTFLFGLIHGFGFAGVLSELNLPAADFAWALLQFNLGIELGQLTIVAVAVGALFVLRERPRYPAWAIRGGSFAAIAIGVLWFIERTANVSLLPM